MTIHWAALTHAYGSADDLPAILQALKPDPADECWGELWSRVCHQGSVYPASAAVLPHLLAAVRRWSGAARISPLHLAGAIVVSQDAAEGFDLRPYRQDVEQLAALARDTLAEPGLAPTDFVYLLQATLALEGDTLWGRQLDRLAEGEFEGECPACGEYLQIAIGEYGFFVTNDEWVNRPDQPRAAIVACETAALPRIGSRLHRIAQEAGQPDAAAGLQHVFGSSTCPACHAGISISEAISRNEA